MSKEKKQFDRFTEEYVKFFFELRLNDNKQWLEQNKQRFTEYCKQPFDALAQELYEHVSGYKPDQNIKPHVSRIYKDMRHYHGGSMYNNHLWLSVRSAEKNWWDFPMFWFGMSPDGYDYGLGYFHVQREMLLQYRKKIDANPERFRQAVVEPMKNQDVFVLGQERYRKKLAEYDDDIMEWYQLKELYMICQRKLDDNVFSSELPNMLKHDFDKIKSIYLWMLELHDTVI